MVPFEFMFVLRVRDVSFPSYVVVVVVAVVVNVVVVVVV